MFPSCPRLQGVRLLRRKIKQIPPRSQSHSVAGLWVRVCVCVSQGPAQLVSEPCSRSTCTVELYCLLRASLQDLKKKKKKSWIFLKKYLHTSIFYGSLFWIIEVYFFLFYASLSPDFLKTYEIQCLLMCFLHTNLIG